MTNGEFQNSKPMDNDLVKKFRDAATMSEAFAVLLPHSEGNVTAKLYKEAADAIEKRDRHILTLQHEMMAEAESHLAEVNRLNKQIKEQPVVRGEWKKTEGFDEYGGGRYVEWTCSVCFSKAKGGWAVRDEHIDEPPIWNFCPNCGADMREQSEEGD